MKIFTMIYRWLDGTCTYCGGPQKWYRSTPSGPLGFYSCPSNINKCTINRFVDWFDGYTKTGCSTTKKFMPHKESKVQKALGLL